MKLSLAIAIIATGLSTLAVASASDFVYPQTGPLTSTYYSPRPYGIHAALDIAGPNGSRVISAHHGRVSFRGVASGYGNLVIVSHAAGYQTYYAHLSRFGNGGDVNRGEVIGYEGQTGHATGPHVHFEIRRYGSKKFIPGRLGDHVTQGHGIAYNYPGID